MDLDIQINNFFQRIQQRIDESTLPEELKDLITRIDLHKIYQHVSICQTFIQKELKINNAVRFDKRDTLLPRTFNIILDPVTDEFRLVLETKRKKYLNYKDDKLKIFSGTSKMVKPAWAIDGEKPQKMANAVTYLSSKADLKTVEEEANVVKNIRKTYPDGDLFLNSTSLGALIEKKGIKKETRDGKEVQCKYSYKISFYSYWADFGTLADFLWTEEGLSLSHEQKNRLIFQLATAVNTLHSLGMIHQDIKPKNILVYRDEKGKYRLELADFGGLYKPEHPLESDIFSTLGYESPEISVMHKEKNDYHHKYYHGTDYESYGREAAKKLEPNPDYKKPNKANDMWSVGIVLYQLYFLRMPKESDVVYFPPFIANLLAPNRSSRLTAQDLLEWLQKDPYVIPDSPLTKVIIDIPTIKIEEFFKRISERVKEKKVPKELKKLIERQDLNDIYVYIMTNITCLSAAIKEGHPIRLDKKQTGLARTLNIIFEIKDNIIMLVFEPKGKTKHHQKTPLAEVYSRSRKSIKSAWRIDDCVPLKIANEVFYATHKIELLEAMREVNIAPELMRKTDDTNTYLTLTARGRVINKEGKRNNRCYYGKISHYYLWPSVINLRVFINSSEAASLVSSQMEDMAEQLIRAMKALHDANMVHQNIKTENILVYRTALGKYCLTLGFFSELYERTSFSSEGRRVIRTTALYESPEISAISKDPNARLHGTYYDDANRSLGRAWGETLNAKPEYAELNSANDAWALGIVLYQLFYKKKPTVESIQEESCLPLIKGLLNPNRENRLTAQEALFTLLLDKGAPPKQEMEALEIKVERLTFDELVKKPTDKERSCWDCFKISKKPAKIAL